MAEEKDIALLADNDIVVEIEVQEAPTVVIESPHTTTAEISGDSALGIVVGALPTLAKEKTLTDGIASIEDKLDNLNVDVDLTPVAKEATLTQSISSVESKVEEVGNKIDNIKLPEIDTTELASKELERFWDVVPEDSEEIISEEDIHAAVEDIWTQTFNS